MSTPHVVNDVTAAPRRPHPMKQRVSDQRALFLWRLVFSAMATWNLLWLLFDRGDAVRDLVGALIGVAGIIAAEATFGRRVRQARKVAQ